MGHYKSECPEWEKEANYAEMDEDMLLMAHTDMIKDEKEQVWFLDSGCSNHMYGTKEWFIDFDGNFRQNVKLGDDRRMMVERKGSLRLEINGITQVISSVYFVPGLRNNLLSVGQLQQKGLRVIMEDDVCEIWHKEQKRLIMHSSMSENRMFIILAKVKKAREVEETSCLLVTEKVEQLWHRRYGHLNHMGLKTLAEKEMVVGLPVIDLKDAEATCEVCLKGKQNRERIPKRSEWKSTKGLQLVHNDICGPISPTSESGKMYIINFIDDYTRKYWTYFLSEKSEALRTFKEFKATAERELGQNLVCLRTDRGGEYNSKAFEDYCKEIGVKRQLMAAYTPQQNGIAERKNRSLMNMARCMLLEMSVPRSFWPEAVQYDVHILNRSPSAALENITPEEKWSQHKPSVEHLRIFGCVAFALVPYERRIKLDEKSVKCVMFGLSKESKAYRLYNPYTKKIVVSRNVHFDESKGWEWDGEKQSKELSWDDTMTDSEEGRTKIPPAEEESNSEESNEEERNEEEVEGEATHQAYSQQTSVGGKR